MLSWKIFTHYMLSRRSGALIRSIAWICMLGVAVGVMSLIVVVGVMNGFNASARDRYLKWEPHVVVYANKGESGMDLLGQVQYALAGISVEELELVETHDLLVRSSEGGFAGVIAKGLRPEALARFMERSERQWFDAAFKLGGVPRELQAEDVMIGSGLASTLRVYEGFSLELISPEALLLPAEQAQPAIKVFVRGRPFETGLEDLDQVLMVYNRELALRTLRKSPAREEAIEIRLPKGVEHEQVLERLQPLQRRVETWKDRNAAMFFALKMEKLVITSFLGLSALITSFSIVTVLVLLVIQKRKDIGMLLAMGLTPKATRRVFTEVGLWLSGFGVGIGLVLGVLICWIIDRYPVIRLPDIYQDRNIPAEMSVSMVLGVVVVSGVIAFVGSWLPSYLSARGTPADSLRGDSWRA